MPSKHICNSSGAITSSSGVDEIVSSSLHQFCTEFIKVVIFPWTRLFTTASLLCNPFSCINLLRAGIPDSSGEIHEDILGWRRRRWCHWYSRLEVNITVEVLRRDLGDLWIMSRVAATRKRISRFLGGISWVFLLFLYQSTGAVLIPFWITGNTGYILQLLLEYNFIMWGINWHRFEWE